MDGGWGSWEGNNGSHKNRRPHQDLVLKPLSQASALTLLHTSARTPELVKVLMQNGPWIWTVDRHSCLHPIIVANWLYRKGSWRSAVPQWEKRFCTSVCRVPWGKICAAKASMSAHKNVVDWDDSAALEAFQDAKARYWSKINGLPCDIPLSDPDFYIEEVDCMAVIDPKLVEDLDKLPPSPPVEDPDKSGTWDSFIYADKPVPITGQVNLAEDNGSEHHSANWDLFLDKQTNHIQATGWGDAEYHQPTNADSDNMWNRNACWGDRNIQDRSWGDDGNCNSWNNRRDIPWDDHSYNWNSEQERKYGQRRNGGHYVSRFSKSRQHQRNNCQTNNSSWKDCRDRNMSDYPYEKTMHAGKPMAVRQWKSKQSYGR